MPLDFAKEIAENLIEVQLPSQINGQNEKAPEAQNILSDKTESKTVNGDINIKEIKSSNAIRQRSHKMLTQNEKYSEADFADFDSSDNSESAMSNLDLIMDVPLEIVVQIGKTQKPVKDIIKLTQGSIIELEKQAGDPVDIMVNGEMIARGDVVVIDDNFGVRITEILNNKTQIKV
jgi:flagellar motor switch protein FliN/FliY